MTTNGVFEGWDVPTSTMVPDIFYDFIAPTLTEAELRVMLYILRRTFGFKRREDAISLSQLVDGRRSTRDGHQLDMGTGMSKSSVRRGLVGLCEKGYILREFNTSPEHGSEPTTYRLRFRGEPYDTGTATDSAPGPELPDPLSASGHPPGVR